MLPAIVIYTDFDGTLTKTEGLITVKSDFFKTIFKLTRTHSASSPITQALLKEKFGEYQPGEDNNQVYEKQDSQFLLSNEAVIFLKTLLKADTVAIHIVTKNDRQYVTALLIYQGFSEEELNKIAIFDSGNKAGDVKNSFKQLKQLIDAEGPISRRYAYIFEDSKKDLNNISRALERKYFHVRAIPFAPGQCPWLDYLNKIQSQLNAIADTQSPLPNQDLFPPKDKQSSAEEYDDKKDLNLSAGI